MPMVLTGALIVLAPLGVILAARAWPVLDRIGVVPLTFAAGFAFALIAPGAAEGAGLRQSAAEISVALALPLILFAANLRLAVRDAGPALKALGAAFIGVLVAAMIGAALFGRQLDHAPDIAGMAVAAYTGSGLNMGAIKTALGSPDAVFLTMVSYDILFSTLYLAVVLLAGPRLAGLILPPHEAPTDKAHERGSRVMARLAEDGAASYGRILARGTAAGTALVLVAALAVVALSVAVASAAPEAARGVVTILVITTLGLAGAFVPRLHRVETAFPLGMYLILIFCFASASLMDPAIFAGLDWSLAGYLMVVIFGSMGVQAALCRLMGIDRDTFLIASGAAVMSVPFIPLIAGALKQRALLVPGIAVAVIGYALGSYLGLLAAWLVGAVLP